VVPRLLGNDADVVAGDIARLAAGDRRDIDVTSEAEWGGA